MLAGRKALVEIIPGHDFKKQLEYLYGRRSTVDALIRSLEEYERFRAKSEEEGDRKTA